MKLTTTRYHVQSLLGQRKQEFCKKLYSLHCDVFGDISPYEFRKYTLEPLSSKTIIQVFKDPFGTWVGYFAFHLFEREINGRMSTIIRADSCFHTSYPQELRCPQTFIAKELFRIQHQYPIRPVYYVGSHLHRSSYSVFSAHRSSTKKLKARESVHKAVCDIAPTIGMQPHRHVQMTVHRIDSLLNTHRQRTTSVATTHTPLPRSIQHNSPLVPT